MKQFYVKTKKGNLRALSGHDLKDLHSDGDYLEFRTNKTSLEIIKDLPETTYYNKSTFLIKEFFKKHIVALIGTLLLILALINQSLSVYSIRFIEEDSYDEEVLNFLEQYYYYIGPFRYLKGNLKDINNDLRSTFYHYEWIALQKSGAILYLDIKEMSNIPIEEDKEIGSLVAKNEGIIKEYHVTKGTVVIQEEKYVNAGDLLISGEVKTYNNEVEFVRATGYVLAEVLEYKDYVIPKKTFALMKTGKIEIYKAYILFGKQINKTPSTFENYLVEEGKEVGGSAFKIKTFYRYEIKDVTNTYTSDEAISYAKSLVSKEFRNEKTIDKERIIYNKLVRIEEDDDNYYIRLIVKTYKNIAMFLPY